MYYRLRQLFIFVASSMFFCGKMIFAEAVLERVPGTVGTQANDQFLLKDQNCNMVKKHVETLVAWTNKVNKNNSCDFSKIQIHSTNLKCQANVTECLPGHVKKFHGTKPANMGPNCWNLSLVMKDILPGLRYSTPEEMAFYMSSPLCRALKDEESKEVGDVGAIRTVFDGKTEESHGFIYLSDDLSYSKNGFHNSSPYEVQSTEKILSIYGVPKDLDCRKNQIDLNSECNNAVSYYRCISFDDYLLSAKDLKLPSISTLKNLVHLESCFERVTVDGMLLRKEALNSLDGSVRALVSYLNDKKSKIKSEDDEQERFILGSIYLRLNAIGEQLEVLRPDENKDSNKFNEKRAYELAKMILEANSDLYDDGLGSR